MSTDRQEHSIADQRREVQAYAVKHHYEIVGEYLDEGISGDATEKRKGFQRMLADAKHGTFQAILCWDQDRFGRFDSLEAGYWIKPLRDAGIWLETVAQGKLSWDDFAGRIVYAVAQEGKNAFLRDQSRNVTRGMLQKAKAGAWLGGPVPYGYRVQSKPPVPGSSKPQKQLVPGDSAQIQTVVWLFNTCANTTTGLGELARQLNKERETPSPAGKLWHKTVIHKMLSRRVYVGDTVWNQRHGGKYHEIVSAQIQPTTTRKRGRWRNDAKEWIITKNTHEPLIERSTFERVQERLIEQRDFKTPKSGGGNFLFTRLLFCSHCGWPMYGLTMRNTRTKTGHGNPCALRRYAYKRYICGAYNAHGTKACQCNTITERQLLADVVTCIQKQLLCKGNLDKLRSKIERQLTADANSTTNVKALRKSITELDHKIDQGSERLLAAPTALCETLTAKLLEWQTQRDKLLADLHAAGRAQPTSKPSLTVDKVIAELKRLGEALTTEPAMLLRELLRRMIDKIECEFDHVPYGKKDRQRSVLRTGRIHLRPNMLGALSKDVAQGGA
jgi:DNA invertase Pin-like site-specific DNA recombinase